MLEKTEGHSKMGNLETQATLGHNTQNKINKTKKNNTEN